MRKTLSFRPGELAALTWDNIDLRNMVIHVEHTLV